MIILIHNRPPSLFYRGYHGSFGGKEANHPHLVLRLRMIELYN
jgi:hypothetical protein